jgi:hypothetical protein
VFVETCMNGPKVFFQNALVKFGHMLEYLSISRYSCRSRQVVGSGAVKIRGVQAISRKD